MKNNYIAALDGIRFLAVTMVLFDHWSGEALGFPASYLGVCLFFVLSGFLITRILLVAKAKDTVLGRSHGFSLKQFYMRRTIRIFIFPGGIHRQQTVFGLRWQQLGPAIRSPRRIGTLHKTGLAAGQKQAAIGITDFNKPFAG